MNYTNRPSSIAERRLRKHIASRSPCVLRGVAASWPCTTSWFRNNGATFIHQQLQQPLVTVHRCRTRTFGHFTEERIALTPDEAFARLYGPQLDGYWYYLTTELATSTTSSSAVPLWPVVKPHVRKYNVWVGCGVHTAAHSDGDIYNVFVQLYGEKEVALLSPKAPDSRALPLTEFGMPFASGARLLLDDDGKSSKSDDGEDDVIRTGLRPGDVLYLPPSWWHEFRIPVGETAASLTCWFK
eukprot:PhM_4_TR17106/c0_g1_i1/m.96205